MPYKVEAERWWGTFAAKASNPICGLWAQAAGNAAVPGPCTGESVLTSPPSSLSTKVPSTQCGKFLLCFDLSDVHPTSPPSTTTTTTTDPWLWWHNQATGEGEIFVITCQMQATVVGLAPCQIKIKVQKRNQHYLKVYYDIIYIYIYIKVTQYIF